MLSTRTLCLLLVIAVLFVGHAHAFGAGNIASISKIEGHNWRHGDIEDMLKTVAFIKGHKWTSMTIKRVYFGNWLRDYSQALDVGTLKGTNAATIRILVWILSFMSFGYATAEFEVTDERLGVYRPEEHIDNPKDYAENQDARQYDPRLRPPVMPEELAVDPQTGMKNYIANERGGWATSLGYIKYSFARSIHYGRVYTNGAGGTSGREQDLCEALRCLGQGLHCLEDFGAHTNYVELALRELGYTEVFPHVGVRAHVNVGHKSVYPLVTGTFGGVDFLHSVLGEATDHVTQSEVDEMQKALGDASSQNTRGPNGESALNSLTTLLSKVPGTGALCQEAAQLQHASDAQAAENSRDMGQGYGGYDGYGSERAGPPQFFAAPPKIDAQATVAKIYPILEFRDKVVRAISAAISRIPGLESLIEKIQERVTLFIMALLAPFVLPLIKAASEQLKLGSSSVIDASGKHQFEPWTDPNCTDPTHSLLSKDHFSNILNAPAGQVASVILQYCAPRVLYAWENPGVPIDQVLNDISHVFHHPAARNHNSEIHRNMFAAVENWSRHHSTNLNKLLNSDSVRAGRNHVGGHNPHTHGSGGGGNSSSHGAAGLDSKIFGLGSHSKVSGGPFAMFNGGKRDIGTDDRSVGLESELESAVQQNAAAQGAGGADPYWYGQGPPDQQWPPSHQQQQQPYPTDYTPHDPATFSTAYSQGYSEIPAGFTPPPPQPPPQQGGGAPVYAPYPPQDFNYGGNPAPGAYQTPPPQQQEGYGYGQYGGYGGYAEQQDQGQGQQWPPPGQGGGYGGY